MRTCSFWQLVIVTFIITSVSTPIRAEREIRVNFSTAELTVVDSGVTLLSTQVVLPKGDYYPVPVRGVVYMAEMGPTWIPTARTRASNPGRYKAFYGAYEPGNAMGHCKISINFDNSASHPIMNAVRIHGNARDVDLGGRLSRSCVRVPDSLCQQLIGLTQAKPVRVLFHR